MYDKYIAKGSKSHLQHRNKYIKKYMHALKTKNVLTEVFCHWKYCIFNLHFIFFFLISNKDIIKSVRHSQIHMKYTIESTYLSIRRRYDCLTFVCLVMWWISSAFHLAMFGKCFGMSFLFSNIRRQFQKIVIKWNTFKNQTQNTFKKQNILFRKLPIPSHKNILRKHVFIFSNVGADLLLTKKFKQF